MYSCCFSEKCYLCIAMKQMFNLLTALLLACVVLSCSDEAEQKRLTKEEKLRLYREDSAAFKVAIVPIEACLPIVVAKELRLFDTLGVDVRLRKYRALIECQQAIVNGKVQAAQLDSLQFATINADKPMLQEGLPTRMTWQLLTSKKARITRLDQFNDKIIAADGRGQSKVMADQAIDSIVRKGQLAFVIPVEDLNVRLSMLNLGNVDAALLPEPYAAEAKRMGAKHIARIKAKPQGGLALLKKDMADETRKSQYETFQKAISVANDSIRQYGKARYMHYLKW